MLVLVVIDTVLLVVAVVYIVALLRSHGDILRRLAILEEGGAGERRRPATSAVGGAVTRGGATGGGEADAAAASITGTTLDGDSAALSLGPGSSPALLAFLTSGCEFCAPFWAGLREDGELGAPEVRVVVVTHDSTRESPARVARLAPAGAEVVMSSAAWEAYAVPASPHFVLTDGRGGISGQGSALSWSQLRAMIDDARGDADAVDRGDADAVDLAAARTTEQRAARSEQALTQAGIGPGHPSLFPSAAGQATAEER